MTIFVINGFDVSGTAGEEIKGARRTIPLGMLWANIGSYVLGAVIIFMLLLAVGDIHSAVNSTEPVTTILNPFMGHDAAKTFEVLAVLSLWVNNFILQMAGARVLWAQARDGQLPFAHFLAKVDKHKVPVNAILVCAVVSFVLTMWSSLLSVLAAMNASLWEIGYAVLIGSVFVAKLRGRMQKAHVTIRGWKLLYPLGFIWSAFITVIMIYQDPRHVGVGIGVALVVGLLVYGLVARRALREDALHAQSEATDLDAVGRGSLAPTRPPWPAHGPASSPADGTR